MSVRMTEIAPSILGGIANIDTSGGELSAKDKPEFELDLGNFGSVENSDGRKEFVHIGRIVGNLIEPDAPIEEDVPNKSSLGVEHSGETMPEPTNAVQTLTQPAFGFSENTVVVNKGLSKRITELPSEANQLTLPAKSENSRVGSSKILPIHMPEFHAQPRVWPAESKSVNIAALEKVVATTPEITEQTAIQIKDESQPVSPPTAQQVSVGSKTQELTNSLTPFNTPNKFENTELVHTSFSRPTPALTSTGQSAANSMQMPDSKILAQISSAISATSKDTVEIRLDPPELGRVVISINQSDSGALVLVSSEKAEISDLLRRHSELLSRELLKSGFDGANLEFSHQQKHSDDSDMESTRNNYLVSSSEGFEADLEIENALRSIAGGLDIRL